MKGISEAEKRGKMLKEEQKQMKENVAAASKQVKNELCYNYLLAFQKYDRLTGKLLFTIVCSFFQSQVWGNLEKLLECKKRCLENAQKSEREDTVIHREPGTETLVL